MPIGEIGSKWIHLHGKCTISRHDDGVKIEVPQCKVLLKGSDAINLAMAMLEKADMPLLMRVKYGLLVMLGAQDARR